MTWAEYYDKINDWAVSTAVSRISSLEDMGEPDEIVDALNIIAFDDEKGANRLLNRALQYNVKFSGENLTEIVNACSEERFMKAVYQSADEFTAQDLEELYGFIDDELIIDFAEKYCIPLPEELREIDDIEQEETGYEVESAIKAVDYALRCLVQAFQAMKHSGNVSIIDRGLKTLGTSWWKYNALSKTDNDMRQAQKAIADLNTELQFLAENKHIQLKYSSLANAIHIWLDDDFVDSLTHLQIYQAQKQIKKVISQVEDIKRKLVKLQSGRG